jgi:hypothetical protein
MEHLSSNDQFSFLTVKRLIGQIRQQNHSIVLFVNCDPNPLVDRKKSSYSESVLEGLTLVLAIKVNTFSYIFMLIAGENKVKLYEHCGI